MNLEVNRKRIDPGIAMVNGMTRARSIDMIKPLEDQQVKPKQVRGFIKNTLDRGSIVHRLEAEMKDLYQVILEEQKTIEQVRLPRKDEKIMSNIQQHRNEQYIIAQRKRCKEIISVLLSSEYKDYASYDKSINGATLKVFKRSPYISVADIEDLYPQFAGQYAEQEEIQEQISPMEYCISPLKELIKFRGTSKTSNGIDKFFRHLDTWVNMLLYKKANTERIGETQRVLQQAQERAKTINTPQSPWIINEMQKLLDILPRIEEKK